MNIVDPILYQARINPNGIAICTPGAGMESVTYGRLAHMMSNVGWMSLSHGLARGQVVAISVKDQILHAAILLGLARLGIVTVSAGSGLPAELGVQALITDQAAASSPIGRIIAVDAAWTMGVGKPIEEELTRQVGKDDTYRIILTSAGGGATNAVALTHDAAWRRSARYAFVNGNRLPHCARLYCDLDLATGPSFLYLTYMLSKGATIYFPGDGPDAIAQAFGLHKIQGIVATASGLAQYVALFELHTVFECCFDVIVCCDGQLSDSLSERVRARMGPHVFYTYGTPETGVLATGSMNALADSPGAVGFLGPDVAAQALDQAGNPVARGQQGALRFRTAQSVSGYLGNVADSEAAFRDGWFHSRALGRVGQDGLLIIAEGRSPVT